MKKRLLILISISIVFSLATLIVYAKTYTPSISEPKNFVTEEMVSTSSDLLSKLNSNNSISKKEVVTDEYENKTLYKISNDKYSVNLDDSNNLVAIYSKYIETTQISNKYDKATVENYILNKYKELNLPSEYELTYLEQFDDDIWEANFEKKYNGFYNKYESVKTFFIPETDEIVALTVFNKKTNSNEISVNKDDAVLTATQNLNIDASDIISSKVSVEKANTYYNESNSDTSLHTSWVLETKDNSFIYVDANSNSIIGGDCIE